MSGRADFFPSFFFSFLFRDFLRSRIINIAGEENCLRLYVTLNFILIFEVMFYILFWM